MRSFLHCPAVLTLLLATLLAAANASAWTPESQRDIATAALEFSPPDLARQIEKHEREFWRGLAEAGRDTDVARHVYNFNDQSGSLSKEIDTRAHHIAGMIRNHRPFRDVVFELGALTHYIADLDNPLNTASSDRREASYYADFWRYTERRSIKFPRVFYGLDPRLANGTSLSSYLRTALQRSHSLYALVGQEYYRFGTLRSSAEFDDRSTAFGVSSVSFSHAITDTANVFAYIWKLAGGLPSGPLTAAQRTGTYLVAPPPARSPAPRRGTLGTPAAESKGPSRKAVAGPPPSVAATGAERYGKLNGGFRGATAP